MFYILNNRLELEEIPAEWVYVSTRGNPSIYIDFYDLPCRMKKKDKGVAWIREDCILLYPEIKPTLSYPVNQKLAYVYAYKPKGYSYLEFYGLIAQLKQDIKPWYYKLILSLKASISLFKPGNKS